MGIRLKLVTSLAAVLIVSSIILGTAFAVREQRNLVVLKSDNLEHSAELAAILLAEIPPEHRKRAIDLWNRSETGGPAYRILFSGGHGDPTNDHPPSDDLSASEVMSTSVPVPASAGNWQLVAVEPLPDSRTLLVASIGEHFVLGVLLAAAAILAVALVCERLVVRPVQWLVAAADSMAQGDDWEPIRPLNRRKDEIGVLGDHFADLSRRLASNVRGARHRSAHLVALRVRRELEDPIRRLNVGLVTLEAVGGGDADIKREIQHLYDQLRAIRQTSARLSEISPDPESAGPRARGPQGGGRTSDRE